MPVRCLQRHEARVDIVLLEAMLQPPVRLASRDRKQPSVALQRVEQLQNAVEQGLLDPSRGAKVPEGVLVILGQLDVLLGGSLRQERGHGLRKAEPDDPPRHLRRWHLQPVLPQAFRKRGIDRRPTVDERAVAIENGEAVHLPPFASSMALTMSSRPARRCPATEASNWSSGLCWSNLRVPRMSFGSISKPTIARAIASNFAGCILSRVHGRSGEWRRSITSLRESRSSTSSSCSSTRAGPSISTAS